MFGFWAECPAEILVRKLERHVDFTEMFSLNAAPFSDQRLACRTRKGLHVEFSKGDVLVAIHAHY